MIKLENVTKKFPCGTVALDDVSLEIADGEFVFLVGSSGAGKTTIFKLLTKEMEPTSGRIEIDGQDLVKMKSGQLPQWRQKITTVYQDLKLLLDQNVFENVALPLYIHHFSQQEVTLRVKEVLDLVGLADHEEIFPCQLSGGELQRVAIARAVAGEEKVLLADEPTGNLDMETAWQIVKLLQKINETGITILMATHNQEIVKKMEKRVVELSHGKII